MSYFNNDAKRQKNGTGVQVLSMENPFDTTNGQPKYPDGLATYSIGRRHQHTSEVQLDDFTVVLFPGSINWCLVMRPETNPSRNEVWANHSTNISFTYSATAKATSGVNLQWEVGLDGFTEWRPVAYAMHLQLLNTTDKNEGWYEAIRIDKNSLMNKWGVLRGKGSPLGNGNFIRGTPHFHMGGVCPPFYLAWNMHHSRQWNQEPTYITGELQDIHNAVFQLNCIKENNEFKKLTNLYMDNQAYLIEDVYQRNDKVLQDYLQNIIPAIHNNEVYNNFLFDTNISQADFQEDWQVQQLVSDAFDIIVLRVHGNANTKLLVHSVANHEFLCAENSQMAQYQTPCDNNSRSLAEYNEKRNARYKYPFHYLSSGGYLNLPRPDYV